MTGPLATRNNEATPSRPTAFTSLEDLPLRMTAGEVCALGRFSRSTLARLRLEDPSWLPPSAIQGGRTTIFDRSAVLKALGLSTDEAPHALAGEQWTFDPDAFRAARSRSVRHRPSA